MKSWGASDALNRRNPAGHSCGVCGKRDAAETMIFSTHTHTYYCTDLVACHRRAERNARAKTKAHRGAISDKYLRGVE